MTIENALVDYRTYAIVIMCDGYVRYSAIKLKSYPVDCE
jgi:hypothetical protein